MQVQVHPTKALKTGQPSTMTDLVSIAGKWILIDSFFSQESDSNKSSTAANLFFQFVPHITITFLNLVVPRVFQKLVIFEEYTNEFRIKITLCR